jgi:hypothetical protein
MPASVAVVVPESEADRARFPAKNKARITRRARTGGQVCARRDLRLALERDSCRADLRAVASVRARDAPIRTVKTFAVETANAGFAAPTKPMN